MTRAQRALVAALVVAFVVLGVVVEVRSAFLRRRMTDVGCYLRAAWAVRAGADVYSVTDDNGWHYNYPPLLAILIAPLADAPPGQPAVTALPFPVSVAVWYWASVAAFVLAVHMIASALEAASGIPTRPFGQRWWAARLVPLLVVAVPAGRTLARGQVNLFVLALLAGWVAGTIRGHQFRAGLCLAVAVCIKVIPALLVLYPLWRRDRRGLAGVAAGLVAGLAVVPAITCGPTAALAQARTFLETTILPGLGAGGDTSRGVELTHANTTDSQSIMTALHNVVHPHQWHRPAQVDPWVRRVHWAVGGVLLLLTLGRTGRGVGAPRDEVCLMGALTVLMAVVSPVCHMHYFVFALPLVAGLNWGRPGRFASAAAIAFVIANLLSCLPVPLFRQYGLTTLAALALWGVAIARPRRATATPVPGATIAPAVAA
jgi:hypothetical protein